MERFAGGDLMVEVYHDTDDDIGVCTVDLPHRLKKYPADGRPCFRSCRDDGKLDGRNRRSIEECPPAPYNNPSRPVMSAAAVME